MILHITDPHFGTEQPAVVRGLLALAAGLRPRVVVVSGDLTQRARRAQFDSARAFVDTLCAAAGLESRANVLILPGNHDIPLFNLPGRVFAPYRGYLRAFGDIAGGKTEMTWCRDDLCIVGADMTRRWRHKNGQTDARQIAAVAARLRGAPAGALRVVVTHQPLHVTNAADAHNLVRGHARAAAAWSAAGAQVFLSGHVHQSSVAPMPGTAGAAATAAAGQVTPWAIGVQTGTAVSTRVRPGTPNSVHAITAVRGASVPHSATVQDGAAPWQLAVSRFDWDAAACRFTAVGVTRYTLPFGN